MNQKVIVLTGPTAVGKTSLALVLAQEFGGEIISADSRQIYSGMNIATAKPTLSELALVPHHLIGVVTPAQEFNLSDFQARSYELIEDIGKRGKLPLVVGGTVLYLNALTDGWLIPKVKPKPEFRLALEEEAILRGPEALYEELKEVDPEAASRIIPNNTRRIIRALEVYRSTGRPFSQVQGKETPPYSFLKLALTLDRDSLYQRADKRIDQMFEQGLVDEVQLLLAEGFRPDFPAMTSLGYSQVTAYIMGELSLQEAKAQMKFSTHRYIRQQYTWFRRDPKIVWLDASEPDLINKSINLIEAFLKSSLQP